MKKDKLALEKASSWENEQDWGIKMDISNWVGQNSLIEQSGSS